MFYLLPPTFAQLDVNSSVFSIDLILIFLVSQSTGKQVKLGLKLGKGPAQVPSVNTLRPQVSQSLLEIILLLLILIFLIFITKCDTDINTPVPERSGHVLALFEKRLLRH